MKKVSHNSDMLVSVIYSGFRDARETDAVMRPGWFPDTAPYTMAVSMWILVSSKVSASCKRCDFCFYLKVTLHTLFFSCSQTNDEEGVPSKRLVNIYNFCVKIWTLLHLSSVLLRSTVSSNFFCRIFISLRRIIVK